LRLLPAGALGLLPIRPVAQSSDRPARPWHAGAGRSVIERASMNIRQEMSSDWVEIGQLLRDAFAGNYEAELVERLRADNLIVVALVAEANNEIVGHIVLSWIATEMDGRPLRAAALAPMAVRPDHQRRGIGSGLAITAIQRAEQAGVEALIVLGHPSYYPRFGFSAELARNLTSPFAGSAFMAMDLRPGALSGANGSVTYPKAFAL
jgi:putative acetyltransferase